ncbi:PKD domain-containing protein [Patescibacteria group bacterium]
MRKIILFSVLILILPLCLQSAQYEYDLGINTEDISFSERLIVGKNIRIYAAIKNHGKIDVSAYVSFYQGDKLIGDSQVVSVRAGGLADEVYVDWKVPSASFNIRAVIKGTDPQDENPSNDLAITTLIQPLFDFDEDGIPDDEDDDDDNDGVKDTNEPILGTDPFDPDTDNDNCLDGEDDFPLDSDECSDNDGDGIGDNQDDDDDNDGLLDRQEDDKGTDPNNPDTDNDGVIDSQDDDPLDPNVQELNNTEPAKPQVNNNTNVVGNVDTSEDEQVDEDGTEEDELDSMSIEDPQVFTLNEMESKILVPRITIQQTQKTWNTFVFRPNLKGLIDDNLTYFWELGDGTTSQQKVVEHQYTKSGNFQVNLKIEGRDDLQISSQKAVKISFFNIGNKVLLIILTLLFLALLSFIITILASKKKK